jgi:hypothetical protein
MGAVEVAVTEATEAATVTATAVVVMAERRVEVEMVEGRVEVEMDWGGTG